MKAKFTAAPEYVNLDVLIDGYAEIDDHVEVEVNRNRTLYVHVNGATIIRLGRIKSLTFVKNGNDAELVIIEKEK